MHQDIQNTPHEPVLLNQVVAYLRPAEGESYLDLTAGYGGHARAILERTRRPNRAVLIDRDRNAVEFLKKEFSRQGVTVIHADFFTASQKLAAAGEKFDCILADLGVSSPHLNQASRGFSIQQDGPLDMRMDQRQPLTADDIVNVYSEKELEALIRRYGEEPRAAQIASLIVHNRPLHTTQQLATVVTKAWHTRSKIHPATRTFQAIRIAVNDELRLLRDGMSVWINDLLAPGGRIAVISFHSLEDRIVKEAFREAGGDRYDATLRVITHRPVTGTTSEVVLNPRARSAKLRVAAKIKT